MLYCLRFPPSRRVNRHAQPRGSGEEDTCMSYEQEDTCMPNLVAAVMGPRERSEGGRGEVGIDGWIPGCTPCPR